MLSITRELIVIMGCNKDQENQELRPGESTVSRPGEYWIFQRKLSLFTFTKNAFQRDMKEWVSFKIEVSQWFFLIVL